MNRFVLCALFALLLSPLRAEIVFEDSFEGPMRPEWSFRFTRDGRARVTTEFGAAEGTHALVLDDSVDDANDSLVEAILTLDLGHRTNVTFSYAVKNLGNEPNYPYPGQGAMYDGVAVSWDGGTTWQAIASLTDASSDWQQLSIPPWLLVRYPQVNEVKIRFSVYDNAQAPLDGIALDSIRITGDPAQSVTIETPSIVTEGQINIGYVLLGLVPQEPLTLHLASEPAGMFNVPQSVTVPAGKTIAEFTFSVPNDETLELSRVGNLTASAPGGSFLSQPIRIIDNETATLTIEAPPKVFEGIETNGIVRLDKPSATAVEVLFDYDFGGRIYLQPVIIAPGQTETNFVISPSDNSYIQSDQEVEIVARVLGLAPAKRTIIYADNETRSLILSAPLQMNEGAKTTARLDVTASEAPYVITLKTEGPIVAPAQVTVQPWMGAVEFEISATDDALFNGPRTATLTASSPGFTTDKREITIMDDDVAAYRLYADSDFITLGKNLELQVSAADPNGAWLPRAEFKPLQFFLIGADGSVTPLSVAQGTMWNGVWNGELIMPATMSGPVRIRVTDASGLTAESGPVDLLRTVAVRAADAVWDARRGLIYASVPAEAPNLSNSIVAIEPITGAIMNTIHVDGNPGALAITSGQEFLYAALNTRGGVARVNLDTFGVDQSFDLIGANSEKLYPEDIETVQGRPELLVVSQFRNMIPRHAGVAVFKNGIRLPASTPEREGSNLIEPSADPNVFFGLETEGSSRFHRLRLGEDGIHEIDSTQSLIQTFSTGILESDGDYVAWSGGTFLNGAEKRVIGSFGVEGSPTLDMAINRAFYLRRKQPFLREYLLTAFDPQRMAALREARLPVIFSSTGDLIRWGTNGLAFTTDENLVITYSDLQVPSGVSADLSVSMTVSNQAARVGDRVTYIVRATNNSANPARNVFVNFSFSPNQHEATATTTLGSVNGLSVTIPTLPPHAEALVEVTTLPDKAETVSAEATVTSSAIDLNPANDVAAASASVGFQSDYDSINRVAVSASRLISDPVRPIIWVATAEAPYGQSVVALDPFTGLLLDRIALKGKPSQLAIAANGNFLYVGLDEIPAVDRIDLTARQIDLEIPLGTEVNAGPLFADDLEVLPGDGTSVLVARRTRNLYHAGLAVFDGATQRPQTSLSTLTAHRIEATATPNIYVGYDNQSSGFTMRKYVVDANGVQAMQGPTLNNLWGNFGDEFRTDRGDLALTGEGALIDVATLNFRTRVAPPLDGMPIVDGANNRMFLAGSNEIYQYGMPNGDFLGHLTFDTAVVAETPRDAVRWGEDGFAILGSNGIKLVRWSAPFPKIGPKLRDTAISALNAGALEFQAVYRVTPNAAPIRVWVSSDLNTWTELTSGWAEQIISETSDPAGADRLSRFIVENNGSATRFVRIGR